MDETPHKDEALAASPDNIRDVLAERLLRIVKDGVKVKVKDEETGEYHIDWVDPSASYLAVVVNYLKNNPPSTMPAAGSPTGVLKEHAKVLNLPFANKEKKTA